LNDTVIVGKGTVQLVEMLSSTLYHFAKTIIAEFAKILLYECPVSGETKTSETYSPDMTTLSYEAK